MTERDTAFGRVNIPGPLGQFIPTWWLNEVISAQARIVDAHILGLPDPRRRGHLEPPTAAEVEEFEQWKRDYERLTEDGYATRWLIQGYEPDEIGEPRGVWVWDETETEYQARTREEQS